jgi:hypothetical protein
MMGKAIVKGILTGQQGGSSGVSTVVTPPGGSALNPVGITQPSSVPPGTTMSGVIQDIATQQTYSFTQPFGAELGLVVGAKVNYTTVNISGNNVANSLRLLQRGEILTINADDASGTLLDHANGSTIPWAMVYAAETGLVAQVPGASKGTMVHFEIVFSPITGQPTAVSLEIV